MMDWKVALISLPLLVGGDTPLPFHAYNEITHEIIETYEEYCDSINLNHTVAHIEVVVDDLQDGDGYVLVHVPPHTEIEEAPEQEIPDLPKHEGCGKIFSIDW